MKEHTYSIGAFTYYQDKLAWRQIRLVLTQVMGVAIDRQSPLSIVASLGAKLGAVLGVILIPEHSTRQEHMERLKTSEAFIDHVTYLEDWLELDTAAEVVRDFLSLNRISYVSEILEEVTKTLDRDEASATTSNESAPSSPGATQPLEMASST